MMLVFLPLVALKKITRGYLVLLCGQKGISWEGGCTSDELREGITKSMSQRT